MSIIGKAAGPLGSFKAWIILNHDSVSGRGVTVSCSPAPKKTVSGDEQTTFQLDEVGTYTITSTDGTFTETTDVEITEKKQSEEVTLTLFDIGITIVISGTTYNISRGDTSKGSSGGSTYYYKRSNKDWDLYLYKSGTVKFTALQTNVDISVVAGGGGGGGGYHSGSGYYTCTVYDGGSGGGGNINTQKNKSLTVGDTYTATVGSGGSGGSHKPSGASIGTQGGDGGNSSFGSYSATKGGGGYPGYNGNGANGSGQSSSSRLFGDSSYDYVSGRKGAGEAADRYGQGGGGGVGVRADNPYSTNGYSGKAGIIAIRNKR